MAEVLEKPVSPPSPMTEGQSPLEKVAPQKIEVIDAVRKEALVRKIGDFYQVSELSRRKGVASEMSVMPSEEFNRELDEYIRSLLIETGFEIESKLLDKDNPLDTMLSEAMGTSVAQENAKKLAHNTKNAETIKNTVENEGGITIPIDETKSRILIKEGTGMDREMVEIHELIHAMASRGPKNGGGFRDSGGGERNLDEAATQVLTLGVLHPELSPFQMYEKIKSGEIETPYRGYVVKLLAGLHATSNDSKPIGIRDLAQYYFHDEEDVQAVLLKMEIVGKSPDTVRERVLSLLTDDLQGRKV